MRPAFCFLAALPLFTALACATGEGNPETPDPLGAGAAGASAGSAGQGGAAASAGGGAGGASAGSGAGGASAGSGVAGSAQGGSGAAGKGGAGAGGAGEGCDPVAQAGCPDGKKKCTVVGESFGCDPDGDVAEGEACGGDTTGDDCGAGLLCVKGVCKRFCAEDKQCGADKSCTLSIDGPGPGQSFKVCEAQGSECDPVAQTGCAKGEGCFPQTAGNKCASPGEVKPGGACEFASDCAAGGACLKLGADRLCRTICDFATIDGCGAAKATCCPEGQACSKIDDSYGICVAK